MKNQIVLDNELDRKYLGQICDIDMTSFKLEPTAQAVEWAEKNPWMYHVLRRGDDVLGYTLVMPLRKSTYNAVKRGIISEDELKVRDIDGENPGGLYIGSIAASPKVRFNKHLFVTGTLCGVLSGQLGRSSREVVAIPITRTGQKLAEMLKMRPIGSELEVDGVGGYSPRVFFKQPYERKTPLNIGN